MLVDGASLFKLGLLIDGILLLSIGLTWDRTKHQTENRSLYSHSLLRLNEYKSDKKTLLVLFILLVIAFVLRINKLDQGMWYDEVSTLVNYVRPSLGHIITDYSSQNQHFLYSILAHVSISIFGESVWALRLPAVIFGVGSIWALYLLSIKITNRKEAILAITLLTFSYHHVWFSQNARGYIGLLFFTIIATWLFIRGLTESKWIIWISYAFCASLGMFTHLTMMFVIISHFVIYSYFLFKSLILRTSFSWRPLLAFCLLTILAFQLYSLVLPQAFSTVFHQGNKVSSEWTNPLWTLMETVRGLNAGFATSFGAFIVLVITGIGLISYARRNYLVILFLILPGLIGVSIVILLHHNVWPRFFFFTVGFCVLILIRGANVFGQIIAYNIFRKDKNSFLFNNLGIGIVICIIALSAISLRSAYYPKQDFTGAREFIESVKLDGDPVITIGSTSVPWKIYYAPDWLKIETLDELNAIKKRSKNMWVVYTFPIYMKSRHPEIYEVIQNDFTVVREFGGTLGDGTIYVCQLTNW